MPKAPPLEYFEVTLRCPKEALGEVVGDLSRRGLTDVSFNLISAVATYKTNKPHDHRDIKAEDFLADWIKDHPTFRAKEAVKIFRADGRTDGACYTALRVMSGDGRLKKLGEGMYSLPGVKALPKPKAKPAKHTKVFHDVSASDFTLRLMSRNHGKISVPTLRGHFEKAGRVPTGVGPVLRKLVVTKKIKSLGDGLYELAPKKTERKTNGAAVVETPAQGA
jgi:hypothetical protein